MSTPYIYIYTHTHTQREIYLNYKSEVLTLASGGFLVLLLGDPAPVLILVIVLKIGFDLRAHRKQRLVAACRAFALWGFDYGFAGHLTVRDPERPDLYWTNPMAVPFSQIGRAHV